MTRKILLFLCGILPVSLFALISGYEAPELQLKFLQNGPVSVGDGIYSSRNPYKKLRVVTIFGTMFPNTDEVLRFLNELQKKYEDQDLKIVAFSPEPENTIQEFLKNLTGVDKLAVAQDPNGVTAKMYLSDQTLSPRIFIINADKMIIWDGSPDDLGNALESMYNGTFNELNYRMESRLQDDLDTAVSSGNPAAIMNISDQILRRNPNNTLALRGYLYASGMLQSTEETFAYFEALRNLHPDTANIYLTMLDLCAGSAELVNHAAPLAMEFAARFPDRVEDVNRVAWGLLTSFPMQAAALQAAGALVQILDNSSGNTPEMLTTRALYYSRIGNLAKAVELQSLAVSQEGNAKQKEYFMGFLQFYQAAMLAATGNTL